MLSFVLLLSILCCFSPTIPNKICLPIHLREGSPTHYAIQELSKVLTESQGLWEVSCSQPDYQLYVEVDENMGSEDDYILIISDVNIQIAGGGDRGIMYGIEEFGRQLKIGDYHLSNTRSVVNYSDNLLRGLQINYAKAVEVQRPEYWTDIMDRMVDLRFNSLLLNDIDDDNRASASIESNSNTVGAQWLSNLKVLAEERAIYLHIENQGNASDESMVKQSQELTKKAVGQVTDDQSDLEELILSRSWIDLDFQSEGTMRLYGQEKNSPILINYSLAGAFFSPTKRDTWRSLQERIGNDQKAGTLLNYSAELIYHQDSGAALNFLDWHWLHFYSWADLIFNQKKSKPAVGGVLSTNYGCPSKDLNRIWHEIEDLIRISESLLNGPEIFFDLSSFHQIDRKGKIKFVDIQILVRQLPSDSNFMSTWPDELEEQDRSSNPAKVPAQEILDSITQICSRIDEIFVDLDCELGSSVVTDQLEAIMLMGRYLEEKINCATKLRMFQQYKKRKYKEEAMSHIKNAAVHWQNYWESHLVEDLVHDERFIVAELLALAEQDIAVVKSTRR